MAKVTFVGVVSSVGGVVPPSRVGAADTAKTSRHLSLNVGLVLTTKAFSSRYSEQSWNVASEHANRKSHPLRASLAQAEEIRTRRHAREINISSQDHNVVFEFSHSTGAEKFSATRIEQRDIVCPLVASNWQLQVQTPCITRNL